MRRLLLYLCLFFLFVPSLSTLRAAAPPRPAAEATESKGPFTVEQLAERCKKSVVVITVPGRDPLGARGGLGSGFVVSEDGLIVTNFHVIGQGRPVTVEFADGKRYEVTSVHASDRRLDLAVLRIDAKNLTTLPLETGKVRDGQSVVALGNPRGLKHSVVAGVISGRRDIEGQSMIQVAIPIEEGNSGGPLLDLHGRVLGIMTARSAVTANLGFAIDVKQLLPLLRKPNSVPMSAWQTIGSLDPEVWEIRGGGTWRRRAGRILGEGAGGSFGGRSLCLAREQSPAGKGQSFAVAVRVRFEDEKGAAGLVFHSDGGDRHYGFYPSNGKLRLVRFEGPDVFSWKVLVEITSSHYRSGDWNQLEVRLERGKIRCYLNDNLVIDQAEDTFTSGRVGLARFRGTAAEFAHFRVGKDLPTAPPMVVREAVQGLVQTLPPVGPLEAEFKKLQKLPSGTAEARHTLNALREQARLLEQQAVQLRKLAQLYHERQVQADLTKELGQAEDKADLLRAALLLARLDNDEVDVKAYVAEVDRLAKRIQAGLSKDASEKDRRTALHRLLFEELGFHGSRLDYYHRSNSYLCDVLDDREGLPITLGVLYIEVARRLGLRMEGVGLPGHFLVRYVPNQQVKNGKGAKSEPELIDVFEGGQVRTRAEAEKQIRTATGGEPEEQHFAALTKKAMVIRMLHNLLRVARTEGDAESVLRYTDTILAIDANRSEERLVRAGLRYQLGDTKGALEDVDWLLEKRPEGINLERVQQMRRFLLRDGRP